MTRPSVVVLAGGASRRMPGTSKLLRRWGDTTVVGAVVGAARAADLSPAVVVVGGRLPGMSDVEGVVVARGGDGRAESLQAGLALAPEGPVIVLLADEPAVRSSTIVALAERCAGAGVDAGRVAYSDRPGHPVWLGPRARAAAAGLSGDADVWGCVSRPPLRFLLLPVAGPAPIDVDSLGDLEEARRREETTEGRR